MKHQKPKDINLDHIQQGKITLERLTADEINTIRAAKKNKTLKSIKRDIKVAVKARKEKGLEPIPEGRLKKIIQTIYLYQVEKEGTRHFDTRMSGYSNHMSQDPRQDPYKETLLIENTDDIIPNIEQDIKKLKSAKRAIYTEKQYAELQTAFKERKATDFENSIFEEDEERLYYRIKTSGVSSNQRVIKRILRSNHYEIDDYVAGYARMKKSHPDYTTGAEKNKLKIGRVLNSIYDAKGNNGFRLQFGEKIKIGDTTYNRKNHNRQYSLNYHNIRQAYEQDPTRHFPLLVITRNQNDLTNVSTDRGWRSCLAADGIHFHLHIKGIKHGVLPAYITSPSDLDVKDPMGRTLLYPYEIENKVHLAKRVLDNNRCWDIEDFLGYSLKGAFGLMAWPASKTVNIITKATGINQEEKLKGQVHLFPHFMQYGQMKSCLGDAIKTFCSAALSKSFPQVMRQLKNGNQFVYLKNTPIYYDGCFEVDKKSLTFK